MNFHDFKTSFDAIRKMPLARMGMEAVSDPEEYYKIVQSGTLTLALQEGQEGFRAEHNRCHAEREWYGNGVPYYKLYPAVIPMFSDISIDVPTKYLTLPFNSFCIRFPEEDNLLVLQSGRAVRAMLCCEAKRVVRDDADLKNLDGSMMEHMRQIYLWIDTGEFDDVGMPILNYLHLPCEPEMSIEKAFTLLPHDPSDMTLQQAGELLRIAVSVCFLATGSDKLVSPDVLSKDLSAWLEAQRREDTSRMKTIEERATRRGKCGWKIGAGERQYVRPRRQENGDGSHAGYELSYQHQRSCHFRIIPSTGIAKFIRQTTVRADLPPKQIT